MNKKRMFASMMFLVLANMACIPDGPLPTETSDATVPATPDATVVTPTPDAMIVTPTAPTVTMVANPPTINVGQSSSVSWTSSNATTCASSGGAQTLSGTWVVFPTMTTTYTIWCDGPGGRSGGSAKVTVNTPSVDAGLTPDATVYPVTTLTVTANPVTITSGQTSSVSWVSNNAVRCESSGGPQLLSDTWNNLTPTTTTTYTIWCFGAGGQRVEGSVTVYVNPAPPTAPTLSFTATLTTIVSGQSTTLNWSTTNATSCMALAGWSGNKPVSGTMVVSPTMNASYLLTCTGPGGSVSQLVSVTVTATTPAPTLNFWPSTTTINVGGTSTLNWSTTNVNNAGCSLSGGQFGTGQIQSGTGGWQNVSPTTSTTYTMICNGSSGSVTKTVTVTVVNTPTSECSNDAQCDDGNSATSDHCDSTGSCVHTTNGAYAFKVVCPSNTTVTKVTFWPKTGSGYLSESAVTTSGGIWHAPAGAGSATVEYPNRWTTYLAGTFPTGAPTDCYAVLAYYGNGSHKAPCHLVGGEAAWGWAHDGLSCR